VKQTRTSHHFQALDQLLLKILCALFMQVKILLLFSSSVRERDLDPGLLEGIRCPRSPSAQSGYSEGITG
jgi:hypothetical protein